MDRLNKLTAELTAFETFGQLEAACKTGYAPSLKPSSDRREAVKIAELDMALVTRGYKVYRG